MAKKRYTSEELMAQAIEESLRSVPEHQDKTDPLVGAIVATADGEILGTAHRGELRIGEHCEFTLIERKLRDKNLKDHVLYVTLEPCTDESRSAGKRGCSSHIVKARIAKVFVGIQDPNPDIATKGIRFLKEQGIEVHMFPDSLQEQIRQSNKDFLQEKEEEAKLVAANEVVSKPKSILEQPTFATVQALSDEAIRSFINAADLPYLYPSPEFTAWGQQFGILEQTDNRLRPTGLGMLLFGKAPEVNFPQSVFKVSINYGHHEANEVRDFRGGLVTQLPAILEFIRDKALRLTMNTDAGFREETADFPFAVLREAIANAIIHRDYSIEGATNSLYIDPQKIVIRSPGGPPIPLTLTDLQSYDVPSVSRNPKIMFIFNQMRLAEHLGIGMNRMKRLMQDSGLALPVIAIRGGNLEITFGRTPEFILPKQPKTRGLIKQLAKHLVWIQQQGNVSASEYAKHFEMNLRTAQRHLSEMKEAGYIESVGAGRGAKYRTANVDEANN